jgi:hypothetical protein
MKHLIALVALLALPVSAAPMLDTIVPGAPALSDTGQELFSVSDIDGLDDDITSFIIGRSAGFSNSLGIYDPTDFTRSLELYDASVDPGFGSGVVLNWDGTTTTYSIEGQPTNFLQLTDSVFGLYLDNGTDRLYSQAILNAAGFDQLAVYETEGQGGTTNGFDLVFAWEDIVGGGDMDYNDAVFGCIDCTAAVPSPAPLALMGMGLALMGWRRYGR